MTGDCFSLGSGAHWASFSIDLLCCRFGQICWCFWKHIRKATYPYHLFLHILTKQNIHSDHASSWDIHLCFSFSEVFFIRIRKCNFLIWCSVNDDFCHSQDDVLWIIQTLHPSLKSNLSLQCLCNVWQANFVNKMSVLLISFSPITYMYKVASSWKWPGQ